MLGKHILFQGVEPGFDNILKRARGHLRRGQTLHQASVDRLKAVQRRLSLGNLYLGAGKAEPMGFLSQPA